MPEAGWYQDPHNPNQQRYWDGNTWTEHTHDAPFHTPPGPDQGQQPYGGPATQIPGYINDTGDWLGRSFSVLFANAMPVFILLLLSMLPSLMSFYAINQVIQDVVVNVGDPDNISVDGLTAGAITTGVLIVIVASLLAAAFTLAQSFVLHRGHVGQPATLASAFVAAAKGLPRYAGWWIAIMVGLALLSLAVTFLVFLLGTVSAVLAGLVIFVLVIAGIPAFIWFITKTGFLSVSAAVAPQGQSALRASTERSIGRFWGVFGRMLLLWVITIVVSMVVQGISSPTFTSALDVDAAGQPTLDGVPFEDLEEVRIGDILPFDSGFVVPMLISGLLTGAVGLYSRSGLAGLYADLKGPSDHPAEQTAEAEAASEA